MTAPGPTRGDADPIAALRTELAQRHPHVMLPDLTRIRDLLDLLGDPQRAYPAVHITGTNGKTSVARMVDALLRAFGVRTGRYTSPHLQHVTERISIDGLPVSEAQLAEVWADIEPVVRLVDGRHPARLTFFELLTALGFAAFADAPVDAAVVEVGLGGRWDATNVLDAGVCVLTEVDLDHTEVLGDTVGEIAAEKVGIAHAGATVVTAPQAPEVVEVLAGRADEVGATVLRVGADLGLTGRLPAVGGQLLTVAGLGGTYDDVFLPLYGAHQAGNAVLALGAVEAFLGGGRGRLDPDTVRAGFAAVDSPGRLEVVRRSPTVLLDGAHNPAGGRALAAALAEGFAFTHLVAVVGVLADKDVAGLLAALAGEVDTVVATQTSSPRALPAEDLAAIAAEVMGTDRVLTTPRLDDALDRAVGLLDALPAGPGGGGVLITGSLVTVGEARTLLRAG